MNPSAQHAILDWIGGYVAAQDRAIRSVPAAEIARVLEIVKRAGRVEDRLLFWVTQGLFFGITTTCLLVLKAAVLDRLIGPDLASWTILVRLVILAVDVLLLAIIFRQPAFRRISGPVPFVAATAAACLVVAAVDGGLSTLIMRNFLPGSLPVLEQHPLPATLHRIMLCVAWSTTNHALKTRSASRQAARRATAAELALRKSKRPGPMRRAEVWRAELPPPVGTRPVVVLTRNAVSDTIGAAVVALVTRTSRGLPAEVSVGKAEALPRPSVVNPDTILTVPRQRREIIRRPRIRGRSTSRNIGLTANSGQSFDFVGTYLDASNSFRSNEAFGFSISGGNPGNGGIGSHPNTVAGSEYTFQTVPEPATCGLLGMAIAGLGGHIVRRRWRRR